MGYTVTFHRASEDASSGSYATAADAVVDALDGHSEITVQVRLPGGVPYVPEDEQITFLGGERSSIQNYRRTWEMTFLRASHKANSINDVADYEELLLFFLDKDYPHFWMDLSAYSTASERATAWHAANTYIPVTLDNWSPSEVDEKSGTEVLTATVSHKWRNK